VRCRRTYVLNNMHSTCSYMKINKIYISLIYLNFRTNLAYCVSLCVKRRIRGEMQIGIILQSLDFAKAFDSMLQYYIYLFIKINQIIFTFRI
jgi:hypothetical protein